MLTKCLQIQFQSDDAAILHLSHYVFSAQFSKNRRIKKYKQFLLSNANVSAGKNDKTTRNSKLIVQPTSRRGATETSASACFVIVKKRSLVYFLKEDFL